MSRSYWYGSADALWRLAVVVLVVVAIPLRMHGLDRSLWIDEAWVANSLLQPDLAGLLYYERYLQTTPPLFLLLERLIIGVVSPSNLGFRLLPFAFGILGVALTAYLALRLLRPAIAFAVTLLLVFSNDHVVYSQMLKQYTSDLFVGCLMVVVGLGYLQSRSTRSLVIATSVFVLVAGLSYNAVLFMPALLYGALFEPPLAPRRWPRLARRPWHVLTLVAATAVTAMVNYLLFIRPNLDVNIMGGSEQAARAWYEVIDPEKVLNLARVFKHFFFGWTWSGSLAVALIAVAAITTLVGILYLVARGQRGRPSNLDKAVLLTLPAVGAFGLNLIGYYPLDQPRLSLFLLPTMLLLFGFGLQAGLAVARLALPSKRVAGLPGGRARLEGALALALAGLLLVRVAVAGPAPFFTWQLASDEDGEAAVAHLARVAGDDAVIYVDTSMIESFLLYSRAMPIEDARIVEGDLAWPCCARNVPIGPMADPVGAVETEIDRILDGGRDEVWMLFTDREWRWRHAGAPYPELFDEQLRARECERQASPAIEGVRLVHYTCERTPLARGTTRDAGRSGRRPSG